MAKKLNFSTEMANVFEDVDSFMAFSQLQIDTAKNTIKDGCTQEEANAAIREKMFAILGVDAGCNKSVMRKAMRKHKDEVYEVIEEAVENLLVSGWGQNPFFNEFVEVKNQAEGDTNSFYVEDKSILTVSELSGGHHDIIRQKLKLGTSFPVKTSWYGVKIYEELEKFMSGRVDWAKMIQKVYEAFNKKVNDLVYAATMAAGTKLPNQSQFNITSALTTSTKDAFIGLIQDVQAATGKEVVIMGTKAALSKLTSVGSVDWISDNMKEELHSMGRLGLFEGTRLVEIAQVFAPNDTTTKLIDNNKLLIMPVSDNKFIKLFNEGDTQIREISDGTVNMDETIEYEFQQKMGVGVVIGLIFGVWTII